MSYNYREELDRSCAEHESFPEQPSFDEKETRFLYAKSSAEGYSQLWNWPVSPEDVAAVVEGLIQHADKYDRCCMPGSAKRDRQLINVVLQPSGGWLSTTNYAFNRTMNGTPLYISEEGFDDVYHELLGVERQRKAIIHES